jgi:hypothetical protein
MKEDEFIAIETQIGWLSGKVVEEDENMYIVEFGGGKRWEVLKEEVFEGKDGVKSVAWW